jgi:hypothetical protein
MFAGALPDYDSMPAGPAMDRLVASLVFGIRSDRFVRERPYSTSTPAALGVVAHFSLYETREHAAGFTVDVRKDDSIDFVQASAPTLALAICRAALKAVAR